MTCPSCQTELHAGVHFCPNCGNPTPTEPGVPARTMPTGAIEVSRIRTALADRYRIERVLGEGGMATVYLAEDLKHRRKVAVKVMRPELAATLGSERFLREVEIAARLSHQNILPVYDSGSADGVLYYVMPVVEGESLPAKLKREKQLPVGEALRIAREVAEALAYAHQRGIIHRDIKPANILLSNGHALVADFGIARATDGDAKALTQTGLAIGTPQYMSPEQASGDPNVDGRTDIYALGCVLYEMLAGEPPFTGPTAQAIITRSITEEPRALTSTRQALAPVVDSAVMRALAKSPADRYATATEMARALEVVDRQSLMVDGQSSIDHRRSTPKWQVAAVAGVVLLIGALGWKAFGGGAATTAVRSVAVLPFINQGADSNAYFADGIVDEVRGRLAKVSGLTVIASASANQYRATTKTGPEIAKELHVERVLMGKVRWAEAAGGGRRVQVVAELVDGETGVTTWQDAFEADVTDVFNIQSQLATRVASALGAVLQRDEALELKARPTTNALAYDLYFKGNAITSRSAGPMREASGYYAQAVALDPTFAEAWARLGKSLTIVYANSARDPEIGRRAKAAIDRALALDDASSTTHRIAATYYTFVARDRAAARRESDRALALDPDDALALAQSANDDYLAEDYASAFTKLSRARELDPLSVSVLNGLVRSLTYLGRVDEALEAGEELIALAPADLDAIQVVAVAHLAAGDLEGARRVVREAMTRIPPTELAAFLAGYQELAFVLSQNDRDLLFRLSAAAFDNDRAWWGQSLAIAAMQQGDTARARAYADSALADSKLQSDANPDDPQLRALYAVMLAFAGRADEAIRQADQAVADAPLGSNNDAPYARAQRIRVLIATGRDAQAIAATEELMGFQYYFNRGFISVDPTFNPIRNDPAFKRMLAGTIGRPVD